MKRFTILLTVCLTTLSACAQQNLPDANLSLEFSQHVKSMDEFMQRFNGAETFPGLKADDPQMLRKNLFSLLNGKMEFSSKEEMVEEATRFVDAILADSTRLHYADSLWYARARCSITYKGKPMEVQMILRTEHIKDDLYRWAICGIDGLEGHVIHSEKKFAISPVEHEIHFIELQSIFANNSENIFGYREAGRTIDQLSVFMALAQTGTIKFNQVENLTYFFFQVPGYMFTVDEFGRRGHNAGWLISSFALIDEAEKTVMINNILGK